MEKQRKNTRRNKGITLIALVITIIILLILAGISIAQLTGTGIFAKAKEAKQKYKDAEDLENQILSDYESQLNSLGKSTVGSGDDGEGGMQGDQPPASQVQSASDLANSENKSEVYGKQVTNYTVEDAPDVKWDIFYADENNIYLIADDYIERSQLPAKNGKTPNDGNTTYPRAAYFTNVIAEYSGSSDITDDRIKKLNNDYFNNHPEYTSTKDKMKAVAYMLDTEIWKKFANEDVADYAIGGPTIELLFKAYNEAYGLGNKYQAKAESSEGYKISSDAGSTWSDSITSRSDYLKTEKPYVISDETSACGMWLASPDDLIVPTDVLNLGANGTINGVPFEQWSYSGFRPLVCLKSDIQLQKSEDGNYEIVNKQ